MFEKLAAFGDGKTLRTKDSSFGKFQNNLDSNFKDLANFYGDMVAKPTDPFQSGLLSDDMLKRNFPEIYN